LGARSDSDDAYDLDRTSELWLDNWRQTRPEPPSTARPAAPAVAPPPSRAEARASAAQPTPAASSLAEARSDITPEDHPALGIVEGAPLTRRALREAAAHGVDLPEWVQPPALPVDPELAPVHQLRPRPKTRPEVLDPVGLWARKSTRPVTVAAAAAVAATLIYAQGPLTEPDSLTDPALELNALTPLREMIDQAAQRETEEQISRSSVRTVSTAAAETEIGTRSRGDSTIWLKWKNPELNPGDSVIVRRTEGTEPAKTIKDGEAVAIDEPQAKSAVDTGLTPGTKYTYAVFIQHEESKPELAATASFKTRLHPIELPPGDSLVIGEKMVSENGEYFLEITEGGKLVLRNGLGTQIWTPSIASAGAAALVMDSTGALELSNDVETLWSTSTEEHPGSKLLITDKGDIQVVDGEDIVWNRGTVGDASLGDDYPFRGGSPLGYAPANCTDFVAWRLNKYAGVTQSPWRYAHRTMTPRGGNAVQWVNYYPDRTDDNPALGAVAWWGSNTGRGYGHVAIVSGINADGSITIEEYNYYNRHAYGKRTLSPGSSGWPSKFIHINDL
jgi:hypothetical protein